MQCVWVNLRVDPYLAQPFIHNNYNDNNNNNNEDSNNTNFIIILFAYSFTQNHLCFDPDLK